ncbi:S-methyl-5'-thioadenosine phosphorylase [Nostoc sp. HG1]|nr:S-methyl-5'-thioadenosine phosphorylase [Nostoc sp. HG1]
MTWKIGVIGGSGLYSIDALEGSRWVTVNSPWGAPSDALRMGTIAGIDFVFLPRHGRGHQVAPGELNARANIDVLKRAGCTDIVSISAVGSLSEAMAPGHFVIVDQFIDRTKARPSSFFGTGMVAHVSMADPVCPRLSDLAADAARAAGATLHEQATYLAMEGPQFSTRAESLLYRQWGAHVIGMTAMPEARLAREAELPYALVAMVTDYDCWREGEVHVDVAAVVAQLGSNAAAAGRMLTEFASALCAERSASPIDTNLDTALITSRDARDPALLAKLDAVAGRAFRAGL